MRLKLLLFTFCVFGSHFLFAADTLLTHPVSPLPQADGNKWIKSLAGAWLFNPAPEAGFEKKADWNSDWKKIEVPGEWTMQGFKVKKHAWAGYVSTWTIPQSWDGRSIKLRCDGIYSEAQVFINGKYVAGHIGGFTPFETDITNFIKDGKLVLAIRVKNEGWADSTSAASSYAVHALGGITRKIQLIALPTVNIGAFQANTTFDKQYNNAKLTTQVTLKNEGKGSVKPEILFELFSPHTGDKVFSKQIQLENSVKSDASRSAVYAFDIPHPLKWDNEHPNLYVYRATLILDGKVEEVTERKIGFRQIEVRGNRLFVNNHAVKLHGVCHHDIMPLRGRSVTLQQCAEDIKIFAQGNVNYIRTSHYPPPEELVKACDSIGMFMEVEAPFCWAERATVPDTSYKAILQDQTLDMVDFFKSHPSVLIWSIGNESKKFPEYFKRTAALVKQTDPSRPRNFSQYEPNGDNNELEIGNHHYPGPEGPEMYKNSKRPIVFDEYSHINAYNRFELVTDPGLRDAWGMGMANMWESMYATPAVLGGALWAGIDDTFILPDSTAVGYGTWGVIDAWRRLKPEYWHMKKAYSPVKIKLGGNWANGHVNLVIENRHLFTNLNECAIKWKLGVDSGTIHPDITPWHTDTVSIPCKKPGPGQSLTLKAWDTRKILVDEYAFTNIVPAFGEQVTVQKTVGKTTWTYSLKNGELKATAGSNSILINSAGDLQVFANHQQVINGLTKLMILPINQEGDGVQMRGTKLFYPAYNHTAANRVIRKINYQKLPKLFKIQVSDSYDEAEGITTYQFNPDGKIDIAYQYRIKKEVNPRQWGLVFDLPSNFSTMSWARNGLWNYYPADHIGRLTGTANAKDAQPLSGPAGPMRRPSVNWSQDQNSLGTNDFRSTKMNIKTVSLSDKAGQLEVTSDGLQHSRCWLEKDKSVGWLIAGYSNLGGERFFRSHAMKFDKPLRMGDVISDHISLNISK